ncbi:hypothetical protein D6851_15850 [Altericroceibacterium spongiae]|uniref:Uncharacterized protein n=1 Tax=Altericroceibacterium spongiae TaxID=2320269 RepID=A0A420EAN6_9SPHN|nr:hypothetical protein [Altericroceibacterium spongiae]RKF17730.1 hypothetical protein D6851_15850 [Altericroceibacterium spongiae]
MPGEYLNDETSGRIFLLFWPAATAYFTYFLDASLPLVLAAMGIVLFPVFNTFFTVHTKWPATILSLLAISVFVVLGLREQLVWYGWLDLGVILLGYGGILALNLRRADALPFLPALLCGIILILSNLPERFHEGLSPIGNLA